MLKEIFHDSLKISKYCNDSYGKPFKGDWLARVVFPYKSFEISAAVAIATFEVTQF